MRAVTNGTKGPGPMRSSHRLSSVAGLLRPRGLVPQRADRWWLSARLVHSGPAREWLGGTEIDGALQLRERDWVTGRQPGGGGLSFGQKRRRRNTFLDILFGRPTMNLQSGSFIDHGIAEAIAVAPIDCG